MSREKIKCPACGALMNNHAEKIFYDAGEPNDDQRGYDNGGVLRQIHGCPGCGNVEVKAG